MNHLSAIGIASALAVLVLSASSTRCAAAAVAKDPKWKGITHAKPDAATRAEEKKERAAALEADKARLQARLGRSISADAKQALYAKLKEVKGAKGWVPELEVVFGIRDMDPILNGLDKTPGGTLAAFKRLKEDLAKRDIDLIVMPLVPWPLFASHAIVDGIGPEDEYYPGWTKMMLEMLAADIEVIDTVDEFRKHATDELVVSWPNDFHTGSLGRQLGARALAKRLQRYDFARDLVQHRTSFSSQQTSTKCKYHRISTVNKGDKGHFGSLLKNRDVPYLNYKCTGDERALMRTELVNIGDSQLHSAKYGSGLPAIINAEVGGIFRWASKSWSGFSPPEIYMNLVPDWDTPPRVVVLSCMTKYWWPKAAESIKPRPLPELGAVDGSGVPLSAFYATVEITAVSDRPTDDASSLDYSEALYHSAAKMLDGPMAGKEIGIRYLALYKGKWSRAKDVAKVGSKMKLRLMNWTEYIKSSKGRGKGQWQVFDTVNQDLLIPMFYVEAGALGWSSVRQ